MREGWLDGSMGMALWGWGWGTGNKRPRKANEGAAVAAAKKTLTTRLRSAVRNDGGSLPSSSLIGLGFPTPLMHQLIKGTRLVSVRSQ